MDFLLRIGVEKLIIHIVAVSKNTSHNTAVLNILSNIKKRVFSIEKKTSKKKGYLVWGCRLNYWIRAVLVGVFKLGSVFIGMSETLCLSKNDAFYINSVGH
jgi:hypothetical protein